MNQSQPMLPSSPLAFDDYHKFFRLCGRLLLVFVLYGFFALGIESRPSTESHLPGRDLSLYRLKGGPVTLAGVTNNASGLTFNRDSGTLFAVINNPEKIIEADIDGNVLRSIELYGFEDTEGITYLGNNQFAIVEERRRGVVLIDISAQTTRLTLADQRRLILPPGDGNNNGFEGLATDRTNNRLFIVSEKHPRQLWQIDGFTGSGKTLAFSNPLDLEKQNYGSQDFSGVFFDDTHRNLLLLSDESKQLTEIDMRGNAVSRMSLRKGHAGLEVDIGQPEGVTLDDKGFLYILSEPNQLLRFEPYWTQAEFAINETSRAP